MDQTSSEFNFDSPSEHDSVVLSPFVNAPSRGMLQTTRKGPIVGRNAKLLEAMRTIARVASTSCSLLITGESGTGKEKAVSALHEASPRRDAPLVIVSCSSIPEHLLESELFGHARGAFPAAHAARQGRLAAAEGGTIFLDEVDDLPLSLQVKLLRVLQERAFTPVGEGRAIPCDVRIVAASNRNLDAAMRDGRFREDLLYRLNVIHVHLPPLRERSEDIEDLAAHFLRASSALSGRADLEGFTPEAMDLLKRYDWPGNVRALENAVERAALLAAGPLITPQDLPARVSAGEPTPASTTRILPDDGIDLRAAVDAFENHMIRQALEKTGGNKNKAAQLLRLNRTTLVEMVKRKRLNVA
jgi:DNA-binding NtrC family response regulator